MREGHGNGVMASARLNGKVALITGSCQVSQRDLFQLFSALRTFPILLLQGLGLAMAKRFGAEGAAVVVTSRRKEKLDATVADLTAQGLKVWLRMASLRLSTVQLRWSMRVFSCGKLSE